MVGTSTMSIPKAYMSLSFVMPDFPSKISGAVHRIGQSSWAGMGDSSSGTTVESPKSVRHARPESLTKTFDYGVDQQVRSIFFFKDSYSSNVPVNNIVRVKIVYGRGNIVYLVGSELNPPFEVRNVPVSTCLHPDVSVYIGLYYRQSSMPRPTGWEYRWLPRKGRY